MPIYEYVCGQCGKHLEIMQKISDAPIQLCPNCQQNTLTKLVSAAGFRLKGSGWYETDFKDSDKKKNVVREEGDSKVTEQPVASTAEKKTDSKLEASPSAETKSTESKPKPETKQPSSSKTDST